REHVRDLGRDRADRLRARVAERPLDEARRRVRERWRAVAVRRRGAEPGACGTDRPHRWRDRGGRGRSATARRCEGPGQCDAATAPDRTPSAGGRTWRWEPLESPHYRRAGRGGGGHRRLAVPTQARASGGGGRAGSAGYYGYHDRERA